MNVFANARTQDAAWILFPAALTTMASTLRTNIAKIEAKSAGAEERTRAAQVA